MKKKAYKIVMIALFAAILVILPVMTFILNPSEPRPFSENENRTLAAFPNVTFNNFKDEKLQKGIEDWFADRFFGRETWIKVKNATERLIGKTDVNGIYTVNDRMMEIWNRSSEKDREFVKSNLKAMDNFAAKYPEKPMYFLLAPTSQEVYSELFPQGAPISSQSEMLELCRENLTKVQTINVMPTMKLHADEYIYYRTDHHWTTYGAYLAYYDAAKAMGLKPAELSGFDIEHVSDSFRGTLYSKTLDDSITPDVMDYYRSKDVKQIKLTIKTSDEVSTYDDIYFREFLDVKDKYSSFLGQNSPFMSIETGSEGPSLLIFKDSYAHCFIPFLLSHYSKISVFDMRYFNDNISVYAKMKDYDSVMFIYNAITFSEDKNIRKLNLS